MKLFDSKKNKKMLALGIMLFLFINNSIFSDEDIIREFFENSTSSLFYVGHRRYFAGTLFSSVIVDGRLETKYTELFFIMPVDKNIGIAIQGDRNNILDVFTFIYEPKIENFRQEIWPHALTSHRHGVLREMQKLNFRIVPFDGIKILFIGYDIRGFEIPGIERE